MTGSKHPILIRNRYFLICHNSIKELILFIVGLTDFLCESHDTRNKYVISLQNTVVIVYDGGSVLVELI